MAKEIQTIDIDGRSYEISQMAPTKSLKTLTRLTKILGEPMILAISSIFKNSKGKITQEDVKKSILDRSIDISSLSDAVRVLISRMDEDEVIGLVKILTTDGVLCDHKPIIFDVHYMGELPHLMRVMIAALGVQYGNFLDAAFAILPVKTARQIIKSE